MKSDLEKQITALAEQGYAVVPVVNCSECGRIIDTRERDEGGDGFGCEMTDGRWVCSDTCWEAASYRTKREETNDD